MDAIVQAALEKWPNVPHAYGWLALNKQGQWLLKGSRIDNTTLIAFINRNYASDARGRWFFQNGPQRVYVELEATPYIAHVMSHEKSLQLSTHTGLALKTLSEVRQTPQGDLVVICEHGAVMVAPRDLALLAQRIEHNDNDSHNSEAPFLRTDESRLEITPLTNQEITQRFGFEPLPAPDPGEPEC
jgi:hypothetical protein